MALDLVDELEIHPEPQCHVLSQPADLQHASLRPGYNWVPGIPQSLAPDAALSEVYMRP